MLLVLSVGVVLFVNKSYGGLFLLLLALVSLCTIGCYVTEELDPDCDTYFDECA